MKKIIRHIRRWDDWRKGNCNSKLHKFLVLIGFIRSPTFALYGNEELIQRAIQDAIKMASSEARR